MISPLASLGSHSCFCRSVPPMTSARVRISGRVISEPPAPSEPRESSSVATTMARYSPSPPSENPPYSIGDGEAERTELRQPGDDVLGDVGVGSVDVLGDGADPFVGEAAERVLNHLEVGVEVARTLLPGQGGEGRGRTPGGGRGQGPGERAGRRAEVVLASEHADGHVVDGVGDEGARDAALDVASGAVVEDGERVLHGGGGVGQVVGDDLMVVGVPGGGEMVGDAANDGARLIDGRRRHAEVHSREGGHGPEGYRGRLA